MSEPYPLPPYAAYIWLVGDQLVLNFPGLTEYQDTHNITLPCDEKGMSILQHILRERNRGYYQIATQGAPTKYMVERALQNDKRYNELLGKMQEAKEAKAKRKFDAEAFLKELGL